MKLKLKSLRCFHEDCRVLKGGVFKGRGNWGTLRIPREDWGTLGNIREPPPLGTPPLNNPIMKMLLKMIFLRDEGIRSMPPPPINCSSSVKERLCKHPATGRRLKD